MLSSANYLLIICSRTPHAAPRAGHREKSTDILVEAIEQRLESGALRLEGRREVLQRLRLALLKLAILDAYNVRIQLLELGRFLEQGRQLDLCKATPLSNEA